MTRIFDIELRATDDAHEIRPKIVTNSWACMRMQAFICFQVSVSVYCGSITLCFIHNDFVHAAAAAISSETARDTAVGRDAPRGTETIKIKKDCSYNESDNPKTLHTLSHYNYDCYATK